jgi:hypothetical protein
MAKFTFTDDTPRVYVDVTDNATGGALYAEPGKTYDLAADPADGRWNAGSAPAPKAPEAPQSAPEAPVEPATPAPDQTPAN